MIEAMTDFSLTVFKYAALIGLPWAIYLVFALCILLNCNKFRWTLKPTSRYPKPAQWQRFWIPLFVLWLVLGIPPMITLTKYAYERDFSEQGRAKTETVGYETRRFVLVEINPPKHMKVFLREVGSTWAGWVTVGKHCNNWRDNPIGAEYNLTLANKRKGDKTWNEFVNVKEAFC